MEYCGKITRNLLSRKRQASVFCGALAMVILIGTAYELPELNYAEITSADKGVMEEMTRNPYRPIAGSINGWNPTDILTQRLDGVKFPEASLEASAARLKNMDKQISTIISPSDGNGNSALEAYFYSGSDTAGNLNVTDESASDHPLAGNISPGLSGEESDSAIDHITPDTPENVIPNTPEIVIPDTPEITVPDIPDQGAPDIPDQGAPDIPDQGSPDIPDQEIPGEPDDGISPDVPNDGGTADVPSDGTDTSADVLAGFEVNADGMICSFDPGAAEVDDGYLVLPNDGCTGIARGAFDGVGAGISDIEIPDNITYIEDGALVGLSDLFCIWTGDANPAYTNVDGVLFDRDMTTIVSFPCGRIGTYEIPSSVSRIGDYAFANTNLSKLVMIKSLPPEVGSMAFGESGGNGLVISAPTKYLTEFQEIFAGFHVTVQEK